MIRIQLFYFLTAEPQCSVCQRAKRQIKPNKQKTYFWLTEQLLAHCSVEHNMFLFGVICFKLEYPVIKSITSSHHIKKYKGII